MDKQAFLTVLREKLSGLPRGDMEERLIFYSEMIDDRMEEGLSEEEAVSAVGSADEIAAQIITDPPSSNPAASKPKRKMRAWEIVLLVLGSPIWLSLAIAAIAVLISFYATIWAVIISLWAVFVSVAACAIAGLLTGIVFVFSGQGLPGAALIGAGFVCAGLTVFLFYGCNAATKGLVLLSKNIAMGIKNRISKKEVA